MTGFLAALVLVGVVVAAVGVVYGVAFVVGAGRAPVRATPFSGGLPPGEHAVSRFHVRWYTVTMLFLAFDMEMVFMYPWTRVVAMMGPSAVVEMFVFLAILVAGVVYAWREGALRWA